MRSALFAVVAGLLVLSPGRAYAQIDFTGAWTLDRDISGDAAKASFEPVPDQTSRAPGGFTGGIGGISLGGRTGSGGRRGSGGGNNRNGESVALTVDERTRLREVAAYVRGFSSLVIEHTDHSTFTVTDAQGRSRLFTTDGKPTPLGFATTTIDTVTRWDGPHLVTTYTIGPTLELVFTYILVPATHQMAVRIRLDQSGRARADVPELRLVYKLKAAQPSSPKSD